MSHRGGCGAVAGAAAAGRERPAGREGCARSRRPADPALAGGQLTPEEPHPCGIAETAGYGAGSQVDGELGYGAAGPGDIPQGRIIGRMDDGALPSRWAGYERRVPSSLEDLRGKATGRVELPLHVAWSGRRVYDVGDDDQGLVLYALLLAEAQREDLERFVHRESLVSMWPRLRRLLGPHARREWERKLMTTACR